MSVRFLQQIELLHAAVQVVASVVPGIALPVDICVGPTIGEVPNSSSSALMFPQFSRNISHLHLAIFRAHIGKGIKHMCQILHREILREMLSGVDCPSGITVLAQSQTAVMDALTS